MTVAAFHLPQRPLSLPEFVRPFLLRLQGVAAVAPRATAARADFDWSDLRPWFGSLVLVVAALYWAQKVLIPIAVAFMLTFVLGPFVNVLQRARLGREPRARRSGHPDPWVTTRS